MMHGNAQLTKAYSKYFPDISSTFKITLSDLTLHKQLKQNKTKKKTHQKITASIHLNKWLNEFKIAF